MDQKSTGLCPRRFESCRLRVCWTGSKKKATERIELSTPGLRDLCSTTELSSLPSAESTAWWCRVTPSVEPRQGRLAQWKSARFAYGRSRVRTPQCPVFAKVKSFHRMVAPEIVKPRRSVCWTGNWVVFNQQTFHGIPLRSSPVDTSQAQGWFGSHALLLHHSARHESHQMYLQRRAPPAGLEFATTS